MSEKHSHLDVPPQNVEYGTLKSYILGLILSMILTFAAYFAVVQHIFSGILLDCAVGVLGIAQAVVQLMLFLHMHKEPKPRWNIVVFLFMLMVLVIIVFGSIWIMNNLNYNLMPK